MDRSYVRQWWHANRSYFTAVLIFVCSRLVVALAVVFASKFVVRSSGDFPDFSPRWYRYLLRWDAGWYLKIASEGYTYNGNDLIQQPVIFYPLYPMLSKVVSTVCGLSPAASLLVVSNLAILVVIPLFFKLVRDDYGTRSGLYAVTALCFFPTSLSFSVGYTESLSLLLIVSFFLLLKRQRYLFAAMLAGLTLATRSTGIVLLLPLLFEICRKYFRDWRRLVFTIIPCAILATSGLWLYMIYLWARFGRPFAFMTDMRAWREGTAIGSELFQAFTLQPFRHLRDIWAFGPDPNTLSPWFFLLFLFLLLLFRKWLTTPLLIYSLGVLLLPYVSLSGSVGFPSFTRYILPAFAVFIIFGKAFARRTWLALSVTGVLGAMLFMYTAFFAQWYFAG